MSSKEIGNHNDVMKNGERELKMKKFVIKEELDKEKKKGTDLRIMKMGSIKPRKKALTQV